MAPIRSTSRCWRRPILEKGSSSPWGLAGSPERHLGLLETLCESEDADRFSFMDARPPHSAESLPECQSFLALLAAQIIAFVIA